MPLTKRFPSLDSLSDVGVPARRGAGRRGGTGIPKDQIFDLFVDSVLGDDLNTGKTSHQPLKTLAALSAALSNGARVGLKRGSYWEEQLNTAAYSDVLIDDYGDAADPMPKIDTSGVANNANFSATPATTNVYEISWTHAITTVISFLRVWEDGDALTFATSVANCDATPGSCWYSGQAQANNPLTVYVHPKGSTIPTSDGKEYRLSRRDHAIQLGDRNTVRDIFCDKNCHNDGLISSSKIGCRVERCITRWGGKHHSVLQPDAGADVAWIGCIAYRQIPTTSQWGSGSNSFTAFRSAPTGGNVLHDGSVLYGVPSIFSHTAGAEEFASETWRNVYVNGQGSTVSGVFSGSAGIVQLMQDCYVENGGRGCAVWEPVTIDGLTMVGPPANFRLFDISAAGAVFQASDVAVYWNASPSGGVIWGNTTIEYDLTLGHATFVRVAPGGGIPVFSDDADTVLSLHDCVFNLSGATMFNLQGANPVTADRNVYHNTSGTASYITNNDTTKSGIVAWRAASGQDTNSVEESPQLSGTPSSGDFSLNPASPAFTGGRNAGARKWRTQPNWAALVAQWDAGFYAHPTDAVGGSQLVVR